MNCDQARHLFDAYLDGELSSSLADEFAAHRLECEHCRRRLALLEVVEHVVCTDADQPEGLHDGFTDRLMACLDTPPARSRWTFNRRWLTLGAPLAAAAAIAFMMYGPFSSGGKHVVLGKPEKGEEAPPLLEQTPLDPNDPVQAWQQWLNDFHETMIEKDGANRDGSGDGDKRGISESSRALTADPELPFPEGIGETDGSDAEVEP